MPVSMILSTMYANNKQNLFVIQQQKSATTGNLKSRFEHRDIKDS